MVFVSAELSRGRGERRSPAPRVALASASAARSLVPCACSSADRAGLFDLLGLRPLADDELVLHGVTQSRRKPPRRRCRPTSSLGRSDRPLALLLSSLFACSETLLSRFLVASQPVRDLLLCARHLFVAARTVWHRRQSSRGERDRVGCSSQFSLTGHLNRGIDGVFELVRHRGSSRDSRRSKARAERARDGARSIWLSGASGRCHRAIRSVLRTAARYECVPLTFDAGVVSLQLMKGLAMGRTIKHMNPPAAVPHVTGADAQSEFSVTLGTSFHRYTRHWRFCFLVAFPVV